VDAASYVSVLIGLALELCLVWRLLREKMWRTYGYFFLYVVWAALRTVVLPCIAYLAPTRFPSVFWTEEAVCLPLNFLVVWEIFRQTFPKGSSLSRIASKGFILAGFALAIFLVDAFWGFKAYVFFNSLYLALERSFGFAVAVLTMGFLLVARYYGVPLGRNVWGMAVGFGTWASILTANNALFDLDHSFIPFWRFVSPLSSMTMLAIWIWAVWSYAPNPVLETGDAAAMESDLNAWTENWDHTVSSTRRIIHP